MTTPAVVERKRFISSMTTTPNPKEDLQEFVITKTNCARDNEVIQGNIPLGGIGIREGQYAQVNIHFKNRCDS
jgi:hypothetical protein